MAESLTERMYAKWRSNMPDPTAHPAWGNLPTEDRIAWQASSREARAVIAGEVRSNSACVDDIEREAWANYIVHGQP